MIKLIATVPTLTMIAVLVVIIGGGFLSKGIYRRQKLKDHITIVAKTHQIGNSFGAGISWSWMGEQYSSGIPYFYSVKKNEEVPILADPQTPSRITLNTWAYNGILDIIISVSLFSLGIGLTIINCIFLM